MERLFYPSYSLHCNKFLIYDVATKNATYANGGRRGSTKTTTHNEQDDDLSYARRTWFLRHYVQRGICNILFRQQLHDDDHFHYLQPYREERGKEKSKSTYYYPTKKRTIEKCPKIQ